MRNAKWFVALLLTLIAFSVFGEEASAPVQPDAPSWTNAVARVLNMLLPIIAGAIAFYGKMLVDKVAAKLGLDHVAGIEDMATDAINKGIHYAEGWAKKQEGKPSGSKKFDEAMKYAEQILGAPFVQAYTREKLEKLLEATHSEHENPGLQPHA